MDCCERATASPVRSRRLEVDYDAVIPFKHQLLETAWTNFKAGRAPICALPMSSSCNEQAHWLDDYALFRALKAKFARRVLSRVAEGAGRAGARGARPRAARTGRSGWTGDALRSSCCSAKASG